MKVGIPRGLFYYLFYPLWQNFFNDLGFDVVVSEKTNKKILTDGISVTVDDICLPVKVYHGHVIDLRNKVDAIFIPRLVSIKKKEYICPKLMGLPDVIRANVSELPLLIDTKIDLSKGWKGLYKALLETGNILGVSRARSLKAFFNALKHFKKYTAALKKGRRPDEILEKYSNKVKAAKFKIMLLGHPYNLYDSFINLNIIEKIEKYGARVLVPENMPSAEARKYLSKLEDKPLFWTLGNSLLSSSYNLQDRKDIHGVILLVSFGCGPDSLIGELIQRWIKKNTDIPFTLLTIDEHSGDAGFNTRIEAFMDMIERRMEDENYISPHG